MNKFENKINELIKKSIGKLPKHLADWTKLHLCKPKEVKLSLDSEGNGFGTFWLVTDNTGTDDSSYRIIYDEELEMFGLECTLNNGLQEYMGTYGSFEETVQNM